MSSSINIQNLSADELKQIQYIYRVMKVVKVVDGDTIDVQADLGFHIYHTIRVRLARINTPEIHGPKAKVERAEGLKAKQFVIDYLQTAEQENRPIYIQTVKDRKGNYGRYLAEVWIYDAAAGKFVNLNDILLAKGLAKPYGGK